MRFEYPASFVREGSSTVISFRDLPEAHTFASKGEDVFEIAQGALEAALEVRIERSEDIPTASACKRTERMVAVPVETALKAALLFALRNHRSTKLAFARQMQVDEKVIRRMLDPHHATKTEKLVRALSMLGQMPVVDMQVSYSRPVIAASTIGRAVKTTKAIERKRHTVRQT